MDNNGNLKMNLSNPKESFGDASIETTPRDGNHRKKLSLSQFSLLSFHLSGGFQIDGTCRINNWLTKILQH